jgi:ferrous iron transport protein B
MSSCCDTSDRPAAKSEFVVALAGNPNSGKTTLFNALTGLRQKVANYPGVTVEKKTGRCRLSDGTKVSIIDLPGTYSLISRSPDERVAMEVLRGLRPETPAPDAVVVVVDASNLQRNLYLVSQLIELGRPLVVALNMMDVARKRGIRVEAQRLCEQLGIPVIPVVGHRREGIAELKEALRCAKVAPMPDWPLPQAMKEEVALVGGGLAILHIEEVGRASVAGSHSTALAAAEAAPTYRDGALTHYNALAERMLIGDWASDIEPYMEREPVNSLLAHASGRLERLGIDPMQADVEAHYRWKDGVPAGSLTPACATLLDADPLEAVDLSQSGNEPARPARSASERADAIFVHKFWGLLIFAVIMAGLFVSIFWLAQPIMDAITDNITALGVTVGGLLPAGPLQDLVVNGIFAGVGAVVVFVPQIALLFLFLAILEDTGYLARAAFLMDRLLSKVGLHGKSFIPLLSSFACAIPGIMATRTIENRKDRLATILVAPFMSCSARLPVYTLLIGTFFAAYGALTQAGIMLSMYALGIVAAAGTAWCFKRTMLRGPATAFILELPSYKMPQVSQVARQVWSNTMAFLTKAGTVIFCLSVILWAMAYYPRLPESQATAAAATAKADGHDVDKAVASAGLEYSIAGRMGHLMEPAIRPLGYDWKMGVGLVGAFAAREVFVSTMAITYGAGDENHTAGLSDAMSSDTYRTGARAGQPVWTPLVAVSLLVWFVLAMQCMSTLAVVRRETGGWSWPLFMLVYMNVLAYVAALIVYQGGLLILRA